MIGARFARVFVPVVAIAALFAACGGDDSAAPATATASKPVSTTTQTSPTAVASPTASPAAPATATPPVVQAPPCTVDQLTLTGASRGAGGIVTIAVTFMSQAGAPCQLTDPLKLTLTDSGGVPLQGMAQNPGLVATNLLIGGKGGSKFVDWSNWCAAPGTFLAVIQLGAKDVVLRIPGPPACTSPKTPSTITLNTTG